MTDLEEIAAEIVAYSDGAYHIGYTEEYEALSSEDRIRVDDLVYQEIDSCDSCGWNFYIDSLEHFSDSGEHLCWQCAETRYEEEEE